MDKIKTLIGQLFGAGIDKAAVTNHVTDFIQAGTDITINEKGKASKTLSGRSKARADAEQYIESHLANTNGADFTASQDRQDGHNLTSKRLTKEISENSERSKLNSLADEVYAKPDPRSAQQKADWDAFQRDMAGRADKAKQKELAAKRDAEQRQWQLKDAKSKTPM